MALLGTPPSPSPALPAVLMATVDSLPEPCEILGLIDASMAASPGIVPTAHLMGSLAVKAAALGADAVIGIRLSQLTLPGASRARVFGRVVDHSGSTVVATALGTAVRTRSAAGAGIACTDWRARPR